MADSGKPGTPAASRRSAAPAAKTIAAALADDLFARTAAEDRAAYSPAALARFAASAAEALARRTPGEPAIRVSAPLVPEPGAAPVTLVEIVNDNMPFLLDSVLGEIQEAGYEIRLVAHPIVTVSRDRSGRLTAYRGIDANGADDALRESLIQLHLAPIGAAEERAALAGRLGTVLTEIRRAVADWPAMVARVEEAIAAYEETPPPVPPAEREEALAFLRWLIGNNFTFLGVRRYAFARSRNGGGGQLRRSEASGLGILADPEIRVLRRGGELVVVTPEVHDFLARPELLIITKANVRSRVHRRAHMDYVGIKLYAPDGRLSGELRLVGLFTSSAYTGAARAVPYIRRKIDAVLAGSGLDPESHSGKSLATILETYPRDELFQIDAETLARFAGEILLLDERPRVRVFVRPDRFDRFVSALVYVPRERYDSDVRRRIGDHLAAIFHGHVSAYYPAFPEGALARVHFIIGRHADETPRPDRAAIEAAVTAIVRTWTDRLRLALEATQPDQAGPLFTRYADAFSRAYRDDFDAEAALSDLATIERLSDERPLAVDFYHHLADSPDCVRLKLVHRGGPIALSVRVPMLENLGFRVIDERTYDIAPEGMPAVSMHDMALSIVGEADLDRLGPLLEDAFLAAWTGAAESDLYNALVRAAGLAWREIALFRAIGRYLRQTGITFSQDYMAAALARHPAIAADILRLFHARFRPPQADQAEADAAQAAIEAGLADVPSLDDDRILRRFANVVTAALRTNYFQTGEDGQPKAEIAFKLDPKALTDLPAPRPFREIFVYSPRVEGVHLRFGRIARGGIRWSDRPEDFRTEILGLVKAQQVKNAVIVPVGAKGGFVPKRIPADATRDAVAAEGKAAYEIFIDCLLDITDDIDGDAIVPPPDLVRHEPDDPYLVVAADKGTATFSDTANAIAEAHDFWLGDAFASGGSAGYDHKEMGITARGAWEAVKRHFREIDVDIQTTPFTVAGVGDMSGDVFGNGMLLSPEIRLLAAFDHRDIFLDPDPDAAATLAERRRLFALPRSSWQDFDRKLISQGGGVFSRKDKAIPLGPEIRAVLGLDQASATPQEVMRAILAAPVDLMWFGGIGTYVRAGTERDAEIGDRANDPLRVTAAQLRAKVVGEGANLAMTQRARIEYGLAGGRCNSDAIDNSAGVNTSDMEVNIKIALGAAIRAGKLDRKRRDKLLASMTEEVAALVLRNNYLQTLAISLASDRFMEDFPFQVRLIRSLEAAGLLDRAVEALPDDAALADRRKAGQALTRAELGVLMAYAKITLSDELVDSAVVDDPALGRLLHDYFPARMRKAWQAEIDTHKLRREIVATSLANAMINRGGPTFAARIADRTGAAPGDIARAFLAVREAYRLPEVNAAIDALDGTVAGAVQLRLYRAVQDLVLTQTVWFVRHGAAADGIDQAAALHGKAAEALSRLAGKADALPASLADQVAATEASYLEGGVPAGLARRIALLPLLAEAADIQLIAETCDRSLADAAAAYFAVGSHFHIGRLETLARALPVGDYYDGLALDRALQRLAEAQRTIAAEVLAGAGRDGTPFNAWLAARSRAVKRVVDLVREMTESEALGISRVSVAANLLADLARG